VGPARPHRDPQLLAANDDTAHLTGLGHRFPSASHRTVQISRAGARPRLVRPPRPASQHAWSSRQPPTVVAEAGNSPGPAGSIRRSGKGPPDGPGADHTSHMPAGGQHELDRGRRAGVIRWRDCRGRR